MGERLSGRTALVTGGGRGQGRAHALALAAEGAAIAVLDAPEPMATVAYELSTAADLADTVKAVEAAGGTAIAVEADVRNRSAMADAVARVEQDLGAVDILVANAGICTASPVDGIDESMWAETIDTNLAGVLWSMQAVLPGMRSRGFGRIIATASMAGRGGTPNLAHYAAAKWGVIGLAKCAALELMGTGITVNVVCPAAVNTPMVTNDANYRLFCPDIEHPTLEDALARFTRMSPLGIPWLEPDDVAREVVHLACDRGITTGVAIELGLGISAKHV
jgi:SDR family mycofactocin-dependent oxidoreductase